MKQKDIALIIIIAVIAAVASIVVSNLFFSTPQSKKQQAEVVQPITADFPKPDKAYFNSSAFDPTKQITIGETVNTDPFKGTGSN